MRHQDQLVFIYKFKRTTQQKIHTTCTQTYQMVCYQIFKLGMEEEKSNANF